MRIKPSNAQNSSSQEQGEPPTKKLRANQIDTGDAAASQSTALPAAAPASLPVAAQAVKSQPDLKVEAPQASLTAMLGEHHIKTLLRAAHRIQSVLNVFLCFGRLLLGLCVSFVSTLAAASCLLQLLALYFFGPCRQLRQRFR